MNRFATLVSIVIAVAILMAFARGSAVIAQGDMAAHPAVGTWTWVNGEGEDAFPSIAHLQADGIYTEVMPWGAIFLGVWEPTGERTAVVTQVLNYLDDDGKLVQGQGRGTMEVDESGNTSFWQGSFLSRYQDGRSDFAFDTDDPGQTSIGTRLEPQPMASLAELMDTPLPFSAVTPTP